jgi:hypothetical protein
VDGWIRALSVTEAVIQPHQVPHVNPAAVTSKIASNKKTFDLSGAVCDAEIVSAETISNPNKKKDFFSVGYTVNDNEVLMINNRCIELK